MINFLHFLGFFNCIYKWYLYFQDKYEYFVQFLSLKRLDLKSKIEIRLQWKNPDFTRHYLISSSSNVE